MQISRLFLRLICVFVLACTSIAPSYAQNSKKVKDLKSQQSRLQKNLKKSQQDLTKTGKEKKNGQSYLHYIDEQLDKRVERIKDIEHDIEKHDVTYENSQARERTQILMDVANKQNGLVVGTGDLSELALGWATYNGDHMSMYGVNASVPKTLIKYLVRWIANNSSEATTRDTLLDIIDTPISPELIPADNNGNIKQKTEDLVGPYELHDFFLYHMLRNGYNPAKIYYIAQQSFEGKFDNATIKKWLTTFCRRFFAQQFKRSCMPDGPKVGSCSLSPRGDWKMPTDACSTLWLEECETL
jgi:NAD+ synthase (glutamine-hydrolysing)